MIYYIINNKIIGYENELDGTLYLYPSLTESQKVFYEANPRATLSEILAEQLNEPTQAELLQRAKNIKLSEFNSYIESITENVNTFTINGKTIKLKANDTVKGNLQDLKGTLDDLIELNQFDKNTGTYNYFFNDGEAMPISITYQDLLLIRVQIATLIQQRYALIKTVPSQIEALTTIEDVEGYTWN